MNSGPESADLRPSRRSHADEQTHIPTVEPRSQAPSWLPCPHGNKSGPEDPERAPRQRPEIAERLSAADFSTEH